MRLSRLRGLGLFGMTLGVALAVTSVIAVAACSGKHGGEPVAQAPRDAAAVRTVDAAVAAELPARALGLPDLAAWGWRKRAGQASMREARAAEGREDWAATAAACKRVLAADPTHLEASWLLAVALAKLGDLGALVAPLQVAATGDLGKWGLASLENPAFAPFLATPAGAAWQRRVEADRIAYAAIVARALVVMAGGDLYAYDPEGTRWYRLTRTYGAVVGGLRVAGAPRLGYLARRTVRGVPALGVGVVDLAAGKTFLPLDAGSLPIALGSGPVPGVAGVRGLWIGVSPPHPVWKWLAPGPRLAVLPPKSKRPPGPWLDATGGVAVLHALPARDVVADWDDRGLASAMRLVKTNRVVAVAGQIAGDTVAWSPDRAAVAFVAEIADECTPGTPTTAAYVVDAGTGTPRELARATSGLALEWLADGRVAVAGDAGVELVALAGPTRVPLVGATDLVTPRHRLACETPEPATDAATGSATDAGPVAPDVAPEDDSSEP